ncbi:catalase [Pleionea sp. CnH1-48]|uniref:catalase n=1 Tax=Pleionea sp. CnH1-48 TaxID=2954494 RepID=UPI0020975C7A|nr:catalase [Pleionea sp. CnH1-48]MCO7224108.1 catalase [Pleionea sp. CnH1-48]
MRQLTTIFGVLLFTTPVFANDVAKNAKHTVESFEKLFGITEGKRRNHTKGFCFEASLIPHDSHINQYSNSPLFAHKSKVIGRLSHKGGNNKASDSKPAEYGMGLAITTVDGQEHRMSMNTLDFFPVATPEAFAELMHAKTQGKEAVKAFKSRNSDLQRFKTHMAKKEKKLTPYEGSTFNSINSFYLTNDDNKRTAVRWAFVPERSQNIVLKPQDDFYFENMQKNLSQHGIVWNMVITIANPDDKVNNAALPWTGKHTTLVAAKLKVQAISRESDGKCDAINFDPLILSSGFAPSSDPLLQARRLSYAISFGKRTHEKHKQKDKSKN